MSCWIVLYPFARSPLYLLVRLLHLADKDTVIKGYSSIEVTIPEAIPVKEATIKQYKVVAGDKIVSGTSSGVFKLENINDSIIKVYVEDSRGNTVEKILNISDYRQYPSPKNVFV